MDQQHLARPASITNFDEQSERKFAAIDTYYKDTVTMKENMNSNMSNSCKQEDRQNLWTIPSSFKERFDALRKLMSTDSIMMGNYSINCEFMLDLLNAFYYECQYSSELSANRNLQKFLDYFNPFVQNLSKLQLKAKDFDLIKVIGFGNFGQVSVVKEATSNSIFAMKTLNKVEMLRRAETACFKEERDVLLHGNIYDWFTKLYFTFQDETNLYFIMDFYIGGDLMTLFSKYDDILPETMSRFYAAQIIKAISVLHEMGYIHRDIKPANILLDAKGHARLADFGSCLKVSCIANNGLCTRAVGTPDYISPDVLKAMEGDKDSAQLYDFSIDWWSLGVVIYESLFGETPFYAESLAETYSKILNHKLSLQYPTDIEVSEESKDLISHLICDQSERYQNFNHFKQHKWFDGIDWDNLRHVEPPYKPIISGPDDTSNFDIDDERPMNNNNLKPNPLSRTTKDQLWNVHLPFVGFSATFSNEPRHRHDNQTSQNIPEYSEKVQNKDIYENKKEEIEDDDSAVDIKQLETDLKAAQQQWSQLSVIVNDIRREKIILSDDLKLKEVELENQIEKTSEIRKKLATLEIAKRQLDSETSRLNFELDKERQANYHLQLEVSSLNEKFEKLQGDISLMTKPTSQNQSMMYDDRNIKEDLIAQQRDYIAHLEEQVLKLQQNLPNWDQQIASVSRQSPHLNGLDSCSKKDFNEYHEEDFSPTKMSDKVEINPTATWRARRSAKAEKHELRELQLCLENELDEKRRIQIELEDKKRELSKALSDLDEVKHEHLQQHVQKDHKTCQSLIESLHINSTDLTSNADFIATLKKDSSIMKLDNSNTQGIYSNYQVSSNISNHSTNLGGFSSTEEGYSEVDSTYRLIRQPSNLSKAVLPSYPSDISNNHDKILQNNRTADDVMDFPSTSQSISKNLVRHMFVVRTFIIPLKCNLCTSLMIGLIRQGLVCENCGIACHINCAKSMWNLNCPHDERRMSSSDPHKGIGTAYSGYVRIPKPGGVRKGWMRMYVVVCDFKLFLYEINIESSGSSSASISLVGSSNDSFQLKAPGVSVSRVFDLRDINFTVSSVLQSDVIHASKTDVACIFRLGTSMTGDISSSSDATIFYQLMLVDRESEKIKWIEALHELQRIVKRNNLPSRNTLSVYPVISTAQLNRAKTLLTINSCAIFKNEPKILIGCDEALVCCYLDLKVFHKLPKGKKIVQLSILHEEQLIVSICGRQRHIKLIPTRALENESASWIKIPQTKNASCFVTHENLPGTYISVAVRKTLFVYEINRRQTRYTIWKEIQSSSVIQTVNSSDGMIMLGTTSSYTVHSVLDRESPPLFLINSNCTELTYFKQSSFQPMGCVNLSNKQWLLVFDTHGVYVDSSGYRCQNFDLQFVTRCNYISFLSVREDDESKTLYLCAYSQYHIDIYKCNTSEWIQTINLRNTRPLQYSAEDINLCITNGLDLPTIVQMSRYGKRNFTILAKHFKKDQQFVPLTDMLQQIDKETGVGSEYYRKVSRIQISEPSDFKHLSHLGPSTKSAMIDLNNSPEKVQTLESKS